jgi:hypothetical protein
MIDNSKQERISPKVVSDVLQRIQNSSYRHIRESYEQGETYKGIISGDIKGDDLAVVVEYACQQIINQNPDFYVLQDSRAVGDKNRMLFWAKNAEGYTTELDAAHRFTKSEALAQQESRETDIPHSVKDLAPVTSAMLAVAMGHQIQESMKHKAATPASFEMQISPTGDGGDYTTSALETKFQESEHAETPVVIAWNADKTKIETILVAPHAYQTEEYKRNPDLAVEDSNLATLASRFWAVKNIEDTLSHSNWQMLSNFIADGLGNIKSDPDAWYAGMTDNVAADMPERVAVSRLELVDRHATPGLTPGKMRLVELTMAARYGEPINESLFTSETFADPDSSWRKTIEEGDIGELAERCNENQRELEQITRDLANLGPGELGDSEATKQREKLTFLKDCATQDMAEIQIQQDSMHSHMDRMQRLHDQSASLESDIPEEACAPGV